MVKTRADHTSLPPTYTYIVADGHLRPTIMYTYRVYCQVGLACRCRTAVKSCRFARATASSILPSASPLVRHELTGRKIVIALGYLYVNRVQHPDSMPDAHKPEIGKC